MNLLEKLTIRVANTLYENLSQKQMEDINSDGKAFKTILNKLKFIIIWVCLFISIFLIGFFFNITNELVIGSLVFFLMRYINDGHHFKSVDSCFLVTISVLISIPIIHYYLSDYTLFLAMINIICNVVFAPFKYQKTNRNFYTRKTFSIVICILAYLSGSLATSAIFIQSIDLIHNIKKKKKVNE
jgi:accessory gene regulator B